MKKFTAILAAAAMLACLITPVSAEIGDCPSDENVQYISEGTNMFTLSDNMKAAIITPSVDFGADESISVDAELGSIFNEFAEIGLNSVIINTMCNGVSYCSMDMNGKTADIIELAISAAYNCGISPYVVFDLGSVLSGCENSAAMIDTLISEVHRFTLKYRCDGIIIDDYYVRRSIETYGGYMSNGSGVGYNNWLYDTAEQYFRTAADVIHKTDNSISVGFMINDMWANASSNADGSNTNDSIQALYDGHADTKSFIENGYADFALLRAYGSTSSQQLPFGEVTSWWDEVAQKSGTPIYIVHHNEKIGTDAAGWNSGKQIIEQLDAASCSKSYSGSVFNSYSALVSNPLESTDAIIEYFSKADVSDEIDEITDENGISEDETASAVIEKPQPSFANKMTSPASETFTTSEDSITFMGNFNSDYPVYFDGEEIKLNEAGNFYLVKKLESGINKFTVKHNGKTYNYSITRKIAVINTINSSISDGKTLSVDGGTKITFSVTAYKGSAVYAAVNGSKIALSEASGQNDEDEGDSSYIRFRGSYTVPEGIVGKRQELGKIKISGTYGGYTMEVMGANVVVNAAPEPVKKQEAVIVDSSTTGSGEVIATLASPHSASEKLQYVRTYSDYTIVYDGKTADDIPSPMFSQLPANTKEVYKSTSGNYYITESGKRIASSASALESGAGIAENKLVVKSVGTKNGDSFIKLSLDHKTGFNMRLAGNSYYTAWDGDYNLKDFTATHLYITFENVTSVTKLPSFEKNLVFKAGKWDTVTEANGTKFRLVLELRQPGVYFGHGASYDGNGDLVLTFPVPTNNLSGLTIVIDPGHGYGKSPTLFDPGAVGEVVEEEVVLGISKKLTEELQAAGAKVIRLKTESQYLLTKERPIYARSYGCDIYLSVHANKATGTARGTEAYYFTSYSEPLAACISSSIASYFQRNVYVDGANMDRGPRYSYYHVTLQQDFPSILIETGFVDNINDAIALASEKHQSGIAKAIVTGIKNFISRSSISYASDGVSSAENTEEKETETTAKEETPETTEAKTTEETTSAPEPTAAAKESSEPETEEEIDEPEEEIDEPEEEIDEPEETTIPEPEAVEETTAETSAPETEPDFPAYEPGNNWMNP